MHYDIVALPKEQWKGTSPCRAGKTLYADARMLQARETISGTIKAYMESEGYAFSPASRIHHSLDALHFTYTNAAGNQDKRKNIMPDRIISKDADIVVYVVRDSYARVFINIVKNMDWIMFFLRMNNII